MKRQNNELISVRGDEWERLRCVLSSNRRHCGALVSCICGELTECDITGPHRGRNRSSLGGWPLRFRETKEKVSRLSVDGRLTQCRIHLLLLRCHSRPTRTYVTSGVPHGRLSDTRPAFRSSHLGLRRSKATRQVNWNCRRQCVLPLRRGRVRQGSDLPTWERYK